MDHQPIREYEATSVVYRAVRPARSRRNTCIETASATGHRQPPQQDIQAQLAAFAQLSVLCLALGRFRALACERRGTRPADRGKILTGAVTLDDFEDDITDGGNPKI